MFMRAGLRPAIAQIAGEKQTIVNLVANGLGIALIPQWTARITVPSVRFIPLLPAPPDDLGLLPLAAAWGRGVHDPARDAVIETLNLAL